MAGLLSAQGSGGGQQASPEEQAVYDEFVNNAYKIIYSEKTFPQFIGRLRQAAEQDPVEGLASTTVMVVVRVQESARRNGRQIDSEIILHAGAEILGSLADTCAKAGIHEYSDKEVEAASLRAMDKYVAVAGQAGLIDQDRAQQDFAAMQQADKEGRLNDMLPGVADRYAPIGAKAMGEAEAEGGEPQGEHGMDPNEGMEQRAVPPRGRR